jgi:two-component system response regulator LytT
LIFLFPKKANPFEYLVKPFNENDLFSSIEIAFNNYNREIKSIRQPNQESYLKDVLFIKDGDRFHKVEASDILYIESDNVYLNIYTDNKHFILRAKLDDFLGDFAQAGFFKVHRSYAVNLKHLEAIKSLAVIVGGKEIPLNNNYKHDLLQKIKSFT